MLSMHVCIDFDSPRHAFCTKEIKNPNLLNNQNEKDVRTFDLKNIIYANC